MSSVPHESRSRRSGKAVTMRQVAERAGVSSMTVSYVVNGKRVSEPNRLAVLAAIDELEYTPNPIARALATANTVRIGLLYQEYEGRTHGFITDLLVGAVRASTNLGVQLVIQGSDTTRDGTLDAIRALIGRGVSGILLPGQFAFAIADAPDLNVPMVALAPGLEIASIASIGIDDREAAVAVTRLLIGQGHRRIGFIHGLEGHPASESRYRGYLAGLAEARITPDPALETRGCFVFKEALPAANALLDLAEPPTAIFAANDDMAAAVISVAHRRHLTIARDLAVVGFDDAPIATQIWPTLTTVRQPLPEIAQLGVEILFKAIRAGEKSLPSSKTLVDFRLIERETTGELKN